MFTTGETVGLAEWIIDDTVLFFVCVCTYVRTYWNNTQNYYGQLNLTFQQHQMFKLLSAFNPLGL